MSNQGSSIDVVISVGPESLSKIDRIARECAARGLSNHQVLTTIGTITGSIPASKLAALSSIPGVLHVEKGVDYRLAPPGAEAE